jgi:hypothetical protein
MFFNERQNGYSESELASLGTADTAPHIALDTIDPALDVTEPRAKKIAHHKESLPPLNEEEKERLYRELEEYIAPLEEIGISLKSSISDIRRKLNQIITEQISIDEECERQIQKNKQGETELSASSERGSQMLGGDTQDQNILNLKIKSIRCGTKIYLLRHVMKLKTSLGNFVPTTTSHFEKAA